MVLPKLPIQFAEFLNHGSPERLSILYLITCVGLRYGSYRRTLEVFLESLLTHIITQPEGLVYYRTLARWRI
jgi:hypothetical protein